MKREDFSAPETGTLETIRGQRPTAIGLMPYETVAFTPSELGGYPDLALPTFSALIRASDALSRLDEAGRMIPNPGLLRPLTLRREAQSTAALEGTYEPLHDVLTEPADEDRSRMSEGLREVFNYLDSANYGFEHIRRTARIDMGLVCALQGLLVRNTKSQTSRAGMLRDTQVVIGAPSLSVQDARFVPMPPGKGLDIALRLLLDWVNSREDPGMTVLDAAMAHYQFETLHPFNDGNGRIGRLLVILQLMQRKTIEEPLLSISPWFEQHREAYQDALLHVSTRGEWNAWVSFFANGIEASAEDTLMRVKRLGFIQQRYDQIIAEHSISGVTRDIASTLTGSTVASVGQLRHSTDKSDSAIRLALDRLAGLGLLTKQKRSHRNVAYYVTDVLETIQRPIGQALPIDLPLRCER